MADSDDGMEIDGEEMIEGEAAAVTEEEEYCMREMYFLSLRCVAKVRYNNHRYEGGIGGGQGWVGRYQ